VEKNDKPTNKPVDYLNHALDAVRYIVMHLMNVSGVGIEFNDDPKTERKKKLASEEYDPLEDNVIWEDM
jgi:hypothetical protein